MLSCFNSDKPGGNPLESSDFTMDCQSAFRKHDSHVGRIEDIGSLAEFGETPAFIRLMNSAKIMNNKVKGN